MKRRIFLLGAVSTFLSACASKFQRYTGPEVTRILVYKDTRRMYLLSGSETLRSYDVQLGFTARGHKQFEGDGKTPEGDYLIDRRNPKSAFHLSLGISYPNAEDRAYAASQGKSPGGDIFIHGRPNARVDWRRAKKRGEDWTAGCISVKNREIEEIYAMVKNGTVISIYP
ncbi:L,D-transpeptidase family protein [Pseudaestuariivita atlantica]|uniref:ErfK/YbiS/YcfS/YnhG family protein n=1 Tax=Pseudaestuariivita atlantica TaxID=1317121 RepID=A0A0L1JQH8_9RHOB|nr:L,D-transpeptidase family protein [Pseudaestuariivita atlantica]KNG93678.1 ErfK/YbiS/YcfS/YnhG family protein [Pseudaestuariivita atlantica]